MTNCLCTSYKYSKYILKTLFLHLIYKTDMTVFEEFVLEHENDDIARLLLSADRWPDIDMPLAADTIISRRKLKAKAPSWYARPSLIYPNTISAEQCSSEETASLKASIARQILAQSAGGNDGQPTSAFRIADITGGLGVDAAAFCKAGFRVLYNESSSALCHAAEHNLPILGCEDIAVSHLEVSRDTLSGNDGSLSAILQRFRPDMIYLDPARRDAAGRKVFLLEDCSPDVISLRSDLLRLSRFLMVKLSPMADIGMVLSRLGDQCREIHVIATKGECRELLVIMDREWSGQAVCCAWESGHPFRFSEDDRRSCKTTYLHHSHIFDGKDPAGDMAETADGNPMYLFEPGKALLKAGASDIACSAAGMRKLARFTHIYLSDTCDATKSGDIFMLGKTFRILEIMPLNNAGIKAAGARYRDADVTARNIPMTSDALRARLFGKKKKSSVREKGQDAAFSGTEDKIHIFGLKCEDAGRGGNFLFVTSPCRPQVVTPLSDI